MKVIHRMPNSVPNEGYQEALESQKEKESEVQNLKDQMRVLEESHKEILECLKHPAKLAQIATEG